MVKAIGQLYERYEVPTLALGLFLYTFWFALIWHQASIPLWLLFLVGGYVTQWHFSLQHESIHAMKHWPGWLRTAFVWPPIGMWLPYPIYKKGHSTHHVNFHLTHPEKDTESYYHKQSDWNALRRPIRTLHMLNQTLAVRLIFGPFIRLLRLLTSEISRIRNQDFANVKHWIAHFISVAVLIYVITEVAGMPLWKYLLCFAYPGMSLGMLRVFTEHRYGERPMERVAIVESNTVMGLMFLFNNIHLLHHMSPTLPWYRIPARFGANREELLSTNGNFYYRGYGAIARRFLFKPVFEPSHPKF